MTLDGHVVGVGGVNEKIKAVCEADPANPFVVDGKRVVILPAENREWYWDPGADGNRVKVMTEHMEEVRLIGVTSVLEAVQLALVPKDGE